MICLYMLGINTLRSETTACNKWIQMNSIILRGVRSLFPVCTHWYAASETCSRYATGRLSVQHPANEPLRQQSMMGNRCATTVRFKPQSFDTGGCGSLNISTCSAITICEVRPRETCGEQKWDKGGRKKKEWQFFLSYTNRQGGEKTWYQRAVCNLAASEGYCRHIYSLCHGETYFSPACGIARYQRLSAEAESFPQQCTTIVSPHAIPSNVYSVFQC